MVVYDAVSCPTLLLVYCWEVEYVIYLIVTIQMCWMNDIAMFCNVIGVFDG
jgi:hypothetical protein